MRLLWAVMFLVLTSFIQAADITSGIKHLRGESDFRDVRLHWDWIRPDDVEILKAFQVQCCEIQDWGPHRCRTKMVTGETERNLIANNRRIKSYSTKINGLRMATNYTFEVRSMNSAKIDRDDRANEEIEEYIPPVVDTITVNTKGFSAKARLCLPTVSQVDVETGPHFGGRISVENEDGTENCAIIGDAESARDTYTLRINHETCGSVVNDTTVTTFVIVQENVPILTHSTRRFLVVCTFQPNTLTVRAGINLPSVSGSSSSHIEQIPYEDMINEVRQQRLIAQPVIEQPVSHIFLAVILVICGIFAVFAAVLRYHRRHSAADTISISSSCISEDSFTDTESISNSPNCLVLKPQDGDVFTVEVSSGVQPTVHNNVAV